MELFKLTVISVSLFVPCNLVLFHTTVWASEKSILFLFSNMSTGRFHDHLLVCPNCFVSRYSAFPLGVEGGLRSLVVVALPGDIIIGFQKVKKHHLVFYFLYG